MIRYKIDVLKELKERGYSTYRLEKEKLIHPNTAGNLRNGVLVSWANIDKVCGLLNCQPGDIVEFTSDQEEATEEPSFTPTPDPDQTPAVKIREIVEKRDLKMKDIAERTGQSPANLSKKLRMDNFSYSDLKELAESLGCFVDVVFSDKETGEIL